ncbi:MAG: TetR/AcrR family transcriptional regulator [Deltaproteobacteria bacterium]|jgi:AcrR family transcriptional regulator|nr:TetR/AcrR family transcriptional regulator [Deltaproteobacteria bacterium]
MRVSQVEQIQDSGPGRQENSRSRNKEISRQLILEAGRAEFIKSGYQQASLRTIARQAGLSVGAVYGHFQDKLSLFAAAVSPACEGLLAFFTDSRAEFDELAYLQRAGESIKLANQKVRQMINYIYDRLEIFQLLQSGPPGHDLEDLINRAADAHLALMKDYNRLLESLGSRINQVSDNVLHILNTSYLTAVFEPVIHGLSRRQALTYIDSILIFFNAGWEAVFQLKEGPLT